MRGTAPCHGHQQQQEEDGGGQHGAMLGLSWQMPLCSEGRSPEKRPQVSGNVHLREDKRTQREKSKGQEAEVQKAKL